MSPDSPYDSSRNSAVAASICAFAMIATQVAGKATRDALFLAVFDISSLPRMVIVASIFTIALVLAASRTLTRVGPGRLVPLAFAGSSVTLALLWFFVEDHPRVAAVVLYLQLSGMAAVLISWFWSMINERFDPRTARQQISRIAAGGTLGGLIGGITAERAAVWLPERSILLVMAGLHLVCVFAAARARRRDGSRRGAVAEDGESGFAVLTRVPYLRNLALLVMAGTVGVALLDFVFKYRAQEAFTDARSLLRFFAAFHTTVALTTLVFQVTLLRRFLSGPRDIPRTVALLPSVVAAGGAFVLALPILPVVALFRGLESASRSSLFRSSYELLFTPIAPARKRATKTIIDVGFDRLGDALGGAIITGVIAAVGVSTGSQVLAGLALVLGLVGFWLTRGLQRGYSEALEESIRARIGSESKGLEEAQRTTFQQSMADLEATAAVPELTSELSTREVPLPDLGPSDSSGAASHPTPVTPVTSLTDEILQSTADLRSGDADRVRRSLRSWSRLCPELVPLAIPLLAWEDVAADAMAALRKVADRHVGQLQDSLVDPDEDFTIRRRIPRVLSACSNERVIAGLLDGLDDRRFEVRYQCGNALSQLHESNPDLVIDRGKVLAAIAREAKVDRRVWEKRRLLDELPPGEESPFYLEVLRKRSSRSLEHVFTMLSLLFPKGPLEIAYRGLHTGDDSLRGTALEYLESVLPEVIRESLWPLLAAPGRRRASTRPPEEALQSLLGSHESIQLNLEELRRESRGGETEAG